MELPTLYINLKRSRIRNQNMIFSLETINSKFYRIEAIDSLDINKKDVFEGMIDNYQYYVKRNIIVKPREKEIAIILSHIKALNFICDNKIDIAVIMEDDISFQYVYNWNEQINSIISNAPKDWKIIKLHTSSPKDVEHNISLINKNIYFTNLSDSAINSAGCYIIKKATAQEILNKYLINNIYTFPNKNEYCVCECIIFSLNNIYMYTVPFICTQDNNVTCAGNFNQADENTNKIIHKYWENIGIEKNKIFENIYQHDTTQKHKIIPIKKLIFQNKK
jgi:GR25 family glycosyltransferase involved in LPS biosynthesis